MRRSLDELMFGLFLSVMSLSHLEGTIYTDSSQPGLGHKILLSRFFGPVG